LFSLSTLEPADAPAYAALAFPRHRQLLLLDAGASGTTVAIGASVLGEPRGLALAGPVRGPVTALLSVVVAPDARRVGLATRLLEELEGALRARGVGVVVAPYRADRAHSEAVARLLARRGFEPLRSVVELVYPIERLLEAPALNVACPGAAVVDFTPERVAPLLELHEPSEITPATVPPEASDPALATLVAIDGEVAACVLGHRAGPETAYIQLLFVRRELRRQGLAAFATRSFLLRLLDCGIPRVSCEVSLDNTASLPFADAALAPYAEHRAIVHVVRKAL
jgi:ribosomal protein S18 acetylase RimI-like enzyme